MINKLKYSYELLIEVFEWIWFLIKLPYILFFTKEWLGGAGGLESEFEEDNRIWKEYYPSYIENTWNIPKKKNT